MPSSDDVETYLDNRLGGRLGESTPKTSEEWETIINTCSYHRATFYFPFVEVSLMAVPISIVGNFNRPSANASLGALAVLPENILSQVVMELDFKSLRLFRNTSRSTHEAVTSVPGYKQVMRHSLRAVFSLYRLNLDHVVTLGKVHRALTKATCDLCDDFAGFLFLPTATRCCYNCLRTKPETAIIGRMDVVANCPQRYRNSLIRAMRDRPPLVFNVQDWLQPGHIRADDQSALTSDVIDAYSRIADIEAHPSTIPETGWLEHRSGAAIPLGHFHIPTDTTEHGISCKGCYKVFLGDKTERARERSHFPDVPEGCEDRDRSFSKQGFRVHFESYEGAKELWARSRNGQNAGFRSDFVDRGGISFEEDQMMMYFRQQLEPNLDADAQV
ncbi:hypothetical protein F53441_9675 [Fusarium austroafricanum]|uniref:F-box domain-containing protein n=1 Tax=Fusarium austroafricanum TaxID=2364996 RepID=A0A8H4KBA6_9HYPO|nr:hypothetical protein F53441_9675 [Fusarium austroafricanum]